MSDESTDLPESTELVAEYQAAFEDWRNIEDAELWDSTVGDGLRADR